MEMTGNTILITGGGSGIGRGLAGAFARLGNQVVIAGRRRKLLADVAAANPGMQFVTLDVADPISIASAARELAERFPALNVIVHNAGIARFENLHAGGGDSADAEAMLATNVLGPIRLTRALMPLLARQPRSAILTVSSNLAFMPLAGGATYCATKAFLHSYTQSLRYQLRDTPTEVIEIIPPYVQTELGGERQKTDPRAMPLDAFIAETMQLLQAKPTPTEVVVEQGKPMRYAAENGTYDAMFEEMNRTFAAH